MEHHWFYITKDETLQPLWVEMTTSGELPLARTTSCRFSYKNIYFPTYYT
jgi:hypothetical protein